MATDKKDLSTEGESVEAQDIPVDEKISENRADEDVVALKDSEINRLNAEISDLKDQYLRKQADMDNFRKRLLKEKEESIAFANKQLLEDFITVIDNFERAIKSSESAEDYTSFHNGIVMIEKEFVGMLERKWHLMRFDSEGEEFDPMKHEAVMVEESSEHENQVVLQDFQKGYMLKDNVLRAAKVKVSMPAEKSEVVEAEESAES